MPGRTSSAARPKVFRGLIGSYGKITGAPVYGLHRRHGDPHAEEAIGYTGEGIILEATALGLGTCWVSGFFRPDAVRAHLELSADERVFAVTPLGYAGTAAHGQGLDSTDGSPVRRNGKPWPKSSKANSCRTLAGKPSKPPASPPRRPTASPGGSLSGRDSITVRTDGPKDGGRYPKRLDCGIAMLHLELGARAAGRPGRWTLLPAPDVARFEIGTRTNYSL